MRKLLSFIVYSLIVGGLSTSFSTKKQSDKPGFRIIKWTKPAECKETGSNFEVGYVLSPLDKMVEIALYLQLTDGNWVVKRFSNKGSGYFKIGASDCSFTGNHYGFVRYIDDKETKFPTVEAVREEHESSDQYPRFKIDKQVEKPECSSIKLETGYVYSPTGNAVEITLFLEKKDKSWRKKIYYYTGTGIIELGIDDCDLTGKFKTHIAYFNK
ncbi:MAG: hypothetical protein EAZ08_13900 [Cytophagales bacterium]|nr:MAG: hypothetical protein EAZ08_13900 [Cytophagales bacterium]